ncbi:MAG: Gfo/Idh/MocA family oxidoreductase [Clostridia bacterium]|nr:Gfo/Idh/MocA family oxidoreductase [Clostridia bacterium]
MLKIGLIGCGFMGGMHAACYAALDNVKVVAVADLRADKAKEVADKSGAAIYENGEALIANADVDAVDICLPTYLHTHHAVLAMKAGKHVFIEKPVALNREEAQLLLDTQKETGAQVQIGQVIRFWDEYVWLKEQIDHNAFGKMRSATFKRLSSWPDWSWDNWLHQAQKSGSVAQDMHIHDVDFMRFAFGDPLSFKTTVQRNADGVVQHIFSCFTYPDNAAVSVEACWDYPATFPFSAHFCVKFENATVMNNANGLMVYPTQGDAYKPELKKSFEGGNDIGGNISDLGGYYNELRYFVENLNANQPLTVAPLDEGVRSLNLILDELDSVGGAQI